MGGIIILATMGNDRSATNTFWAVVTVCGIHRLVAYLKSVSPKVGAVVDGPPLVLLKDGQWQIEAMNRMVLKDDDVMAAVRSKGAKTFRE